MDVLIPLIIAVAVLAGVATFLRRQRERASEADPVEKSRKREPEPEPDALVRRAPVREFHVHGNEARVTFDVPLADEVDEILNELLVDEAIEVLRDKRHSLPIDDVTEVVAFAGMGEAREVGRAQLPSPGELPPPVTAEALKLSHIAKDPFAGQFETDHSVQFGTAVHVPTDDLGPLRDELKVPAGLERGLRAHGVDPETASGPDFVLGLLGLFDYSLSPQAEPETYIATKAGTRTFIRTVIHSPGTHPELDEAIIRRFSVEFGASGAERGILITDKYGPFLIHDVERIEPRIRFVTRERVQRFIDSMALG
ncbi:MAG: hypothetical protein IH943_10345 [Acidobacteria bacterium]|nr:hypothetical protein [Acidobacteriota bacterium]